jgi:hypothetical protein
MKIKLEYEFEMVYLRYLKKRGIHGHPQAYDLTTTGPLLLPHHIMLLISNKKIFSSP